MKIKICIKTFCLLVSSMLVISGCNSRQTGSINCTLRGEVIDRPQSSQLLLLKEGEDPRINAVSIPINEGKFEYILDCEYEELYQFVFYDEFEQGAFRPVLFFMERGVINFTLHPTDRFNENKIEGGKLNREYMEYKDEISNKSREIKPHQSIDEKVKQQIHAEGWLNAETYPLYLKIAREDSLYQEWLRWKIQYIRERPSIVGYSILVS